MKMKQENNQKCQLNGTCINYETLNLNSLNKNHPLPKLSAEIQIFSI